MVNVFSFMNKYLFFILFLFPVFVCSQQELAMSQEVMVEGERLFDPCFIEVCDEECDDVLGESHFEEDLAWLYKSFSLGNTSELDLDENGMIDVVQAWLLDEVLRDKGYSIHCCVKNAYRRNVESARLYADKIQSVQPVVFLLIDRVKFEGVISGLTTVGEQTTIDMLLGMIDKLPIEVPMPDMELFDLSMGRYLSKAGDADLDGICNYGEYRWNLIGGYGIGGYKESVLDGLLRGDGGGCVWCGEGEPPEGEGILEGIPEGIIEGEGESPQVFSSLTVIIMPEEAILNGAQWQIEGDTNLYNSGDKVENLYAGSYRVFFTQPIGWSTSEYIQVEIGEHENKVIEIKYWESGGIVVNIFPEEAVQLNARWKANVRDEWKNSGELLILPVGWSNIEFSSVEGYISPSQKQIYIPHGLYINIDVSYQKIEEFDKETKRFFALQIYSTYSYCDIDGDDLLTLSEILQKYPQITPEFFDEIDADKDQKISREELENYIKSINRNYCGNILGSCKVK